MHKTRNFVYILIDWQDTQWY